MESLRNMLPWGGLRKIAREFKCSPTHVANILDGRTTGYDEIIERAEVLIKEEAKRRKEEEIAFLKRKREILSAVK